MKYMYISICMGISKWKIFIFEVIKYIHFYREIYHRSLEYAVKKRVSKSIQQYKRKLNTHILSLNSKICAPCILQMKKKQKHSTLPNASIPFSECQSSSIQH